MISLNGEKVALLSAAVARVSNNENHKFPGDKGIDEIAAAVGAESVSVYDLGPRDAKTRFVRFDFAAGAIEFEVGPQPELIHTDNRPDGDNPPPGTPIAMAA